MPSDASTNLRTSAAAAFCARILVHPLDNIRVSIQYAKGVPAGSIPSLGQLLTAVRQQLQLQQKKPEQHPYLRHHSPKFFYKERMAVWRGVYKGASFAVMFQVPALAAFLSTYDATKHGLAYMANAVHMPSFQLHDTETHLVSGMIAKAVGTLVWAPMNRIQSVATTHSATGPSPLTLRDAYRVARQICRSEGASGLWTGYSKSLSTLLPYTMIYFATYEQLKQMARAKLPAVGHEGGQAELDLTTYMMCVATAVTTSSAVCETAAALNSTVWGRLASMRSIQPATAPKPTLFWTVFESLHSQPLSNLPLSSRAPALSLPSARYPSSLTAVASAGITNFKCHALMPPQFKTLMSGGSMTMAHQAGTGLSWQQSQLATLTTTSRLQFRSNLNYQCVSNPVVKGLVHPGSVPAAWQQPYTLSAPQQQARTMAGAQTNSVSSSSVQSSKGVIRTIVRGLGPRVLWTVPGVTLTTAGFETLRNMASIST
ncbi:hypothetical protein EC968_001947 [Mortierella alpina]|nr:hypothetical protein EC968_001947 [Mortierella alpina]